MEDTCDQPLFTDIDMVSYTRGQFHQYAYAQLLLAKITKGQKDSQVMSSQKVDQLVVLQYFSRFVLYAVRSSLMKLTPGDTKQGKCQHTNEHLISGF